MQDDNKIKVLNKSIIKIKFGKILKNFQIPLTNAFFAKVDNELIESCMMT